MLVQRVEGYLLSARATRRRWNAAERRALVNAGELVVVLVEADSRRLSAMLCDVCHLLLLCEHLNLHLLLFRK